jgi:hypothetical protein
MPTQKFNSFENKFPLQDFPSLVYTFFCRHLIFFFSVLTLFLIGKSEIGNVKCPKKHLPASRIFYRNKSLPILYIQSVPQTPHINLTSITSKQGGGKAIFEK